MPKLQYSLILRVSRINKSLILSCNIEKVYRVHLNGLENHNTLNYDEASEYFNSLEAKIYHD